MLFNLGCYSLNQDEPLLYLISLKNHFPYKSRMAASASSLTRVFTSLKLFKELSSSPRPIAFPLGLPVHSEAFLVSSGL